MPRKPFETVAMLQAALRGGGYLASDGLSVSLFLALAKSRPLFLEGEAGVGKTEIAKMLARLLGRDLIRLQCYEGLEGNICRCTGYHNIVKSVQDAAQKMGG